MEDPHAVTDVDTNDDFEAAFEAYAEGKEPELSTSEQEQEAAEDQESATEQAEDSDKSEEDALLTDNKSADESEDSEGADDQQDTDNHEYWKHRYESDIGRVNAYQRKADDAAREVATLRQEIEKLKNQPPEKAADNETAAVTIDGVDMEEVKEFAPDIHAVLVQQSNELNTLKTQLQEQQQAQAQRADDDHIAAITAAHADVGELINAPEFADWLNQQTPAVRRITEQGSSQDVIWMLDQYKQARESAKASKVQNKRQERLKKAATLPNRQQSSNQDDGLGDFESAFNHYADKKERGS